MRPLVFVLACARTVPAPGPPAIPVLDAALARPVPPRIRARFSIAMDARAFGAVGSTGGALILDRPGRGHLAVLGPFGGPLATFQTEGTGLAVAFPKDGVHYVGAESEAVLRRASGGALGLDEVLGLFEGQLPFGRDRVTAAVPRPDGDLELRVTASEGVTAAVVLDDLTGAPVSVAVFGPSGALLLDARYGPFQVAVEGGPLLPTSLALSLPGLGVSAELAYRAWEPLDEVPDVFGLAPPPGFVSAPLELLLASIPAPSAAAPGRGEGAASP